MLWQRMREIFAPASPRAKISFLNNFRTNNDAKCGEALFELCKGAVVQNWSCGHACQKCRDPPGVSTKRSIET